MRDASMKHEVSMMSKTLTKNTSNIKNKEQELKIATSSQNLDTVLNKLQKIDNTCSFISCKNKTNDFAIDCKYCKGRLCPSHALPEIHGCGAAVRKDEREKYFHPNIKLSDEKHSQAKTKLTMKLKMMQQDRKSKQSASDKKGKK